jgi:fibronectin-binding autotransporter adhesin
LAKGFRSTGTVTSVAITESGDSLNITGSPITTSGTINIGFNGTNLQYVNGAGNLTTFPILTGYVPYTGATGDVNLGLYSLTSNSIKVIGDNSTYGGTLSIKQSNVTNLTGVGYTELFGKTNRLGISFGAGSIAYLSNSTLTAERTYTFPDATGTIALTSDLSAYVTLAGTETITGIKNFNLGLTLQDGYYPTPATGYVGLGSNGSGITILTKSGITVYNNNLQFPNASNDYNFPNATGTLALTSDLSAYVTLAGTETITGAKTFSATSLTLAPTSGGGTLNLKQDAFLGATNGYTSLTSSGSDFAIIAATGVGTSKQAVFSLASLGATLRTYTLPDANGILALTSDLSAYVTLAGTETITGAKTFSGLTSFTNTSGINLQYGAYINKGNTPLAFSSGNTNIYSDATTNNIVIRDNLSIAKLEFNNSTQTYTFPAATGTIALTSDLTGGTVTSVAALTIGTTGTDLSSTVANSTTTPVITLNVPTASAVNRGALSSADWTTFNNKQSALTNPVTGTGTTNYLPKFTGASTIGDSNLVDINGYLVLGAATSTYGQAGRGTFEMNGSADNIFVQKVNGTLQMYIYTGASGTNEFWSFNNLSINSTNGTVTLSTGGTTRLNIDGSGNTAIGYTTNPSTYKLDVNGTGRFSGALTLNGGDIDGTLGDAIYFGNAIYPSSQKNRIRSSISASSANYLVFETSTATTGVYNTNQFVLLGTGAATFTGNNSTNTTENASVSWNDSNGNLMGKIVGYRGADGNDGNLRFYTSNTPTLSLTLASTGAATFETTSSANAIFNSTNASGGFIAFRRSGTNIGYLGNSAQLGIGTLNALELRADNNLFLTTTSGTLSILSTGNVGIGTASPNARLSLGTGTTSKLLVYDGGFTGSGGNGFFAGFAVDYPSGNDFGMFAHNNGALVFGKYTNNNDLNNVTERMRITSGGQVLIGATSYDGVNTNALQIKGSTAQFLINNTVGKNAYNIRRQCTNRNYKSITIN